MIGAIITLVVFIILFMLVIILISYIKIKNNFGDGVYNKQFDSQEDIKTKKVIDTKTKDI